MKATDVKEPGYYWWDNPSMGRMIVEVRSTSAGLWISAGGLAYSQETMRGGMYGPIRFDPIDWISEREFSIGMRWDDPYTEGPADESQ